MGAKARFDKKNYDRITLLLPKGTREVLKAQAEAQNMSVNKYLVQMIENSTGIKLTLDGVLPWMNSENKN